MFHQPNSDTWQDHPETIELQSSVFQEPDDFIIRNQPQSISRNVETEDNVQSDRAYTSRRQIPISTIDWQSTDNMQVLARNGVDFLRGIEQVYIQQSIELTDLMSNVTSENRYKVIIPHGETLFYAVEHSTDTHRMLCGSNREFTMHLYDHSQQEAMTLKRSYTLGCCSIWCKMQNVEVWIPNNRYIGRIKQLFSLSIPTFVLYDNNNTEIYRIEGPSSFLGAIKEAHFGIYSSDGLTQLGSIIHQWDQIQNDYNIAVTFPGRREDPKFKALVLGAAFLLEYMYFFHSKKAGSNCWC